MSLAIIEVTGFRSYTISSFRQLRLAHPRAERRLQVQSHHGGGLRVHVGGRSRQLRHRFGTRVLRVQGEAGERVAVTNFTIAATCLFLQVLEHLNVEHLPEEEKTRHVVRVGFSTDDSGMQLGLFASYECDSYLRQLSQDSDIFQARRSFRTDMEAPARRRRRASSRTTERRSPRVTSSACIWISSRRRVPSHTRRTERIRVSASKSRSPNSRARLSSRTCSPRTASSPSTSAKWSAKAIYTFDLH